MEKIKEKRIGLGPIPSDPEHYINERQVHGLIVLKMFGWNIVCIRRPTNSSPITILRNRKENALGVLGEDGILKLSSDIKIRDLHREDEISFFALLDRLYSDFRATGSTPFPGHGI